MSKFDMIRSILSKNKSDMSIASQRAPLIASCVIREVKKDMRADIYVPAMGSVLMGVRVVFPSLGDKYGDILSPAENSEGLYIITTEGHRFVLGGVSPTENFFPHQIMPRETERYNENAFQKIDRQGSIVTSSSGCANLSLMGDGRKIDFHNGSMELSLSREKIESEFEIGDKVFITSITRHYREIVSDIKKEDDPSRLMDQASTLVKKVNMFLSDVQNEQHGNEKPDYKQYMMKRVLYKIVQEGVVFKEPPLTTGEISQLTMNDVEMHQGEMFVYKEEYFDKHGGRVRLFAITENGLKV